MDVLQFKRQLILMPLLLLMSFLLGCAKAEYGTTVFPITKKACETTALREQFIVYWQDGHVSVIKNIDREELISNVLEPNLDLIRRVEHDQKVMPQPLANLYALNSAGMGPPSNWGQKMVQVESMWAEGLRGDGALVAVIDSGLDITHPQLSQQIAFNEGEIPNNGIDDDDNGWVDDYAGYNFADNTPDVHDEVGHGTHVAGIIAARHEDGPVLGLAPGAKILPLKFLSEEGGSLGDAIMSMKYASEFAQKNKKPLIINASWGGANCSNTFVDIMSDLQKHQVLFVVASGNNGADIDIYPEYPAALEYPHQITVGAITSRGFEAGFSNYGFQHVHILAPGQDIFSSHSQQPTRVLSGTSMAAPFVAGAAALLWAQDMTAPTAKIRQALLSGVEKGAYAVQTQGYLNVKKANDFLTTLRLTH
jgi:subtilisin family serine protease